MERKDINFVEHWKSLCNGDYSKKNVLNALTKIFSNKIFTLTDVSNNSISGIYDKDATLKLFDDCFDVDSFIKYFESGLSPEEYFKEEKTNGKKIKRT